MKSIERDIDTGYDFDILFGIVLKVVCQAVLILVSGPAAILQPTVPLVGKLCRYLKRPEGLFPAFFSYLNLDPNEVLAVCKQLAIITNS